MFNKNLKITLEIIGGLLAFGGFVWACAVVYSGFETEIKQLQTDHSALSKKVDQIRQESADFKQFALRELERSRKPPSRKISADRLAGTWNLIYGNSEGRLGVKAINETTIEFFGEISQGKSSPALPTRGRGVLTETALGPQAELDFHTKSPLDQKEWTGTAHISIFSADFAQGWFVDQERHMDNVELRRRH